MSSHHSINDQHSDNLSTQGHDDGNKRAPRPHLPTKNSSYAEPTKASIAKKSERVEPPSTTHQRPSSDLDLRSSNIRHRAATSVGNSRFDQNVRRAIPPSDAELAAINLRRRGQSLGSAHGVRGDPGNVVEWLVQVPSHKNGKQVGVEREESDTDVEALGTGYSAQRRRSWKMVLETPLLLEEEEDADQRTPRPPTAFLRPQFSQADPGSVNGDREDSAVGGSAQGSVSTHGGEDDISDAEGEPPWLAETEEAERERELAEHRLVNVQPENKNTRADREVMRPDANPLVKAQQLSGFNQQPARLGTHAACREAIEDAERNVKDTRQELNVKVEELEEKDQQLQLSNEQLQMKIEEIRTRELELLRKDEEIRDQEIKLREKDESYNALEMEMKDVQDQHISSKTRLYDVNALGDDIEKVARDISGSEKVDWTQLTSSIEELEDSRDPLSLRYKTFQLIHGIVTRTLHLEQNYRDLHGDFKAQERELDYYRTADEEKKATSYTELQVNYRSERRRKEAAERQLQTFEEKAEEAKHLALQQLREDHLKEFSGVEEDNKCLHETTKQYKLQAQEAQTWQHESRQAQSKLDQLTLAFQEGLKKEHDELQLHIKAYHQEIDGPAHCTMQELRRRVESLEEELRTEKAANKKGEKYQATKSPWQTHESNDAFSYTTLPTSTSPKVPEITSNSVRHPRCYLPEQKRKRDKEIADLREKQRKCREEKDFVVDEVVELIREFKMNPHVKEEGMTKRSGRLYPPSRGEWATVKEKTAWERWDGDKWVEELGYLSKYECAVGILKGERDKRKRRSRIT